MQQYKNIGGDSGVESYMIGEDYIDVKFINTLKIYRYSYGKAGKHHVDQMKILAINGKGLNSYINRYVRKMYD